MERKIAIVGAGISGLVACKHTLEKGFKPVVFEATNSVGGVWFNNTISSTTLQTPKNLFQFSDFEWPSSVNDTFPHHSQVLEYINSYAVEFDILQHVEFNTKVVSIDYSIDNDVSYSDLWGGSGEAFSNLGKWNVLVQDLFQPSKPPKVEQFDFVILCIGKYSDLPNIPQFPMNQGPKLFKGEVLHSMNYAAMGKKAVDFIKDKRVVVVGFQKSAVDIVAEVAKSNGVMHPCTLLYKTTHWTTPDDLIKSSFQRLNRFSEYMIHKPGEGFCSWLLAICLCPLVTRNYRILPPSSSLLWIFSKLVEIYLTRLYPLKEYDMVPRHSYLQQIVSCMLTVLPDKFYNRVRDGSIILKKVHTFNFSKSGLTIHMDDGVEHIAADIVIFATGYKSDEKLANTFVSPNFQKCITGSSTPFYRDCIHPRIPQLAILGYALSTSTLFVTEMRSKWLAHFLAGTFKLPTISEMEEDVIKWENCMNHHYPQISRRDCIGVLMPVYYNDLLCKDMKINPRRKRGFFDELFQPYTPSDYAGICYQDQIEM